MVAPPVLLMASVPLTAVARPAGAASVVGDDLVEVGAAAGENGRAVIGGVLADAVDFRLDRGELRVQRLALRAVIDGSVGRLGGQSDGAVQQGGDLRQGAIGDLQLVRRPQLRSTPTGSAP